MKILFLNCEYPFLERAFESLGHETVHNVNDLQNVDMTILSMKYAAKRPFELYKIYSKKRLGPVVVWDRDGPSHMGEKAWRLWVLKHFRCMDLYATHTLQDAGLFSNEVLYFANAACTFSYNLNGANLASLRDASTYKYDVTFFGETNGERFPEMLPRAEFLKALAVQLDKLDISYSFYPPKMSLEEQISFIQSSKINLNFHAGCDTRWQGGWRGQPKSWGLPERCYGVPATGGFLLSDERVHYKDDFSPDEYCTFSDLDDCVTKIRYYISNFEASRVIAEKAYKKTHSSHTYVHRATRLLDFYSYWKEMQKFK
ncbi:glycosyltransferase [Leeia sp. TBRC 13508]|uniref:Glycosyltransferase n=1 Tax=Leeia speluncae TaxID=2884804 RepID=A0ABS8D5D1_9NEIS|nr:glycosyltransferase [Leeia speluncae]MCB6183377.1 glycosyltransferase [Leeia speluncae]